MIPELRICCQTAAIDGLTPEEHYAHCTARLDEPQPDTLFDLPDLPDEPQQGGPLL